MTAQVWSGRSVLLTGHTGFKGSWLSLMLRRLGAQVHGYALDPVGEPSLFEQARIAEALATDCRANLLDLPALTAAVERAAPEVVFHLAAQPLVRVGYADPVGTFATNAMGTVHMLEACRRVGSVRAIVVVTTDKVYRNEEDGQPYAESEPLGGHDPYSASKAAAEIITASYRSSYLRGAMPTATARAGNVLGGGDWAIDRLVPDCLRAFEAGEAVYLRRPGAIRPWQHVLEPLSGYLTLAEHLLTKEGEEYAQAWNFGPEPSSVCTVKEVAIQVAELWGDGATVTISRKDEGFHEAGELRLDSSKATSLLHWHPQWSLAQALAATVAWHKSYRAGEDVQRLCERQIEAYAKGQSAHG
jgi:CDP-glucose 4,6-dehydratase